MSGSSHGKEVKITLTTLFELLKREKDNESLQKLDSTFFDDVIDYINSKKKLLLSGSDTFSSESDKIRVQIRNTLRIVKDLYDRRERKIMSMAMNKSRTGSQIIDSSALLGNEQTFFKEVLDVLSKNRRAILGPVFSEVRKKKSVVIKEAPKEDVEKKEGVLVKFIGEVPEFLGKDMKTLGPFSSGDEVLLPKQFAALFISTGKAIKQK